MKQSKKIAITGGIGSGKSTVAKMIAERGYPVFSCDEISREIYRTPTVFRKIASEFPSCVSAGEVDRKALAKRIFDDPIEREKLESIVHPAIMRELFEKIKGAAGAIVFAEVPLLFECGYEKMFDGVIVVLRDKEKRIAATAARDCVGEEEVLSRMENQFDYENKSIFEHTVIENDGTLAALREKVGSVLEKIRVER